MGTRSPKPVPCEIAGMWCHEPKNCGECPHFIENSGVPVWCVVLVSGCMINPLRIIKRVFATVVITKPPHSFYSIKSALYLGRLVKAVFPVTDSLLSYLFQIERYSLTYTCPDSQPLSELTLGTYLPLSSFLAQM